MRKLLKPKQQYLTGSGAGTTGTSGGEKSDGNRITPEFKSQLQGYLHLLRSKIKAMEQQIVEIQLESNQLKDDLEQSMQREMHLMEELKSQDASGKADNY